MEPKIVIEDLNFYYNDKQVIHDLNLKIRANEILSVFGPAGGAGRQTSPGQGVRGAGECSGGIAREKTFFRFTLVPGASAAAGRNASQRMSVTKCHSRIQTPNLPVLNLKSQNNSHKNQVPNWRSQIVTSEFQLTKTKSQKATPENPHSAGADRRGNSSAELAAGRALAGGGGMPVPNVT